LSPTWLHRPRGGPTRFPFFGGLSVFAVACALYIPSYGYEFVYDDVHVIRDNELVHSIGRWWEILGSPWWPDGLYRPLTSLLNAVNWVAGHGDPRLFHLTNIMLAGLAATLVFALAAEFLGPAPAFVAGLLFAVHPVHVEAVANVVGRAEVLATIFTVTAAICYAWDGRLLAAGGGARGRRPAAAVGTLLALLCALASKESAFAAPGLLVLVDWADRRAGGSFIGRWRRHLPLWSAAVVITAGWLLLRWHILGDIAGDQPAPGLLGLGMADRTLVMLPVALQYARLLVFPAHLSADYSPDYLPVTGGLTWTGVLALGLVGATAGTAWLARRKAPVVTFGLGWIVVALLIVSNIVVPSGILLAERALYLPSVGIALVGAGLWSIAAARAPALAVAALILVLAAGVARSLTREPVWRSDETFFPALVRDAPGSFRGSWVAGMLAYQRGDRADGERLIRHALKVYPLHAGPWADLARELEQEGRWQAAGDARWGAFRADGKRHRDAAQAIADLMKGGAIDLAARRAQEALAAAPRSYDVKVAASDVALAQGQPAQALAWRRSVALQFPARWQYWYLTAEAARQAHDCGAMAEALERLRVLQPSLPELAPLDSASQALHCRASG
jgi:tetratricopeptide (TPR) repeat protein